MKKFAAVIAIVAITASMAFAFPGGGRGYGGCGDGQGYGQGMMGRGGQGAGPCVQTQTGDPVDDAGAKAVVEKYLSENLKGYEITDAVKKEVRRGMVYRFAVEDKNGNQFVLMVNPFGQLRGPIPVQEVK